MKTRTLGAKTLGAKKLGVLKPGVACLVAALAVAACASRPPTAGPAPVSAPRGDAKAPSGALELGDWRRGSVEAVLRRYGERLTRRYAAGTPLLVATGDLGANGFSCVKSKPGAGDPPAYVCRRRASEAGCTHTWQAHLWSDGGAGLSRLRPLYDRVCAQEDDGLLGG